jgi:SAM-dependent MidA family methyltransferase
VTLERPSIEDELAARIERHGSIPFDEFMQVALYDPTHGFYATGGAAGRRGDFITSSEVGPLFGAVIGRALDQWWDDAGRPDPFVVAEAGAGIGTLAVGIRASAPRCSAALTYVLAEQSETMRRHHGDHLPLSAPSLARPPEPQEPPDDESDAPTAGNGPRFVSLPDLPAEGAAVVLANELLDNLPFRILERADGCWHEVRVSVRQMTGTLVEQLVPAPPDVAALADRFAPAASAGARIPLQDGASSWLKRALHLTRRGRLVVIDYAASTAELADKPRAGWLRTYRGHSRGLGHLQVAGDQDITAEVCIDQLSRIRPPDLDRSQAEFLHAFGIHELVEEGRQVWHERAHLGDLPALKARSRVREAEALLDPAGLGAFRVLEWGPPSSRSQVIRPGRH